MRVRMRPAAMFAMAIGLAAPAAALADDYLKLTGFNGGDWIPVLSFSLAEGRGGGMTSGAGGADRGGGGGEVVVQLPMDATASSLMQAASRGTHFSEADLKMGGPNAGVTYRFEDVAISGFQADGGGDRPHETVTLRYLKLEIERLSGVDDRAGRDLAAPARPLQGPVGPH